MAQAVAQVVAQPVAQAIVFCGLWSLFTLPLLPQQSDLPRELQLLQQVKRKMRQNLSRIPSYTCLETITRERRDSERFIISVPGKAVPFRRLDVLRLEVAEVGGKELFAHAGDHQFEDREIGDFAKGGLIGNGIFSLFAHDVFATSVPSYKFVGETVMDGRPMLRFDFSVSLLNTAYRIGTNLGSADVGFHGSFWADPETFDVARLDVLADDVPRYTGLSAASNRVDFANVRIGSSLVLLPQSGELSTRMIEGWESRNRISFTHCREYGVQSVIRFEDASSADDKGAGSNYVELPSGLQLSLRLETAIDDATARVGDILMARTDSDVRHKGKILVPAEAVISGRLRRLEKHTEGWPYVLIEVEFTDMEFAGKQTRFFAHLEKLLLPHGAEGPKRVEFQELPGVGVITAMGNRLRLPQGTRMLWKTTS